MREVLTRGRIVNAAWQILNDDGLDAISLRRVASDLDVTAPALYAHITGKEDLLASLAERALGELKDHIAPQPGRGAAATIVTSGRAYVRHLLEHPNSFRLLFRENTDVATGEPAGARHPEIEDLFACLGPVVERGIANGELRDVDADVVAFGLWAAAHGLATGLHLGRPADDADQLVESVLDTLVTGLSN